VTAAWGAAELEAATQACCEESTQLWMVQACRKPAVHAVRLYHLTSVQLELQPGGLM
jgi:hypothetical protein